MPDAARGIGRGARPRRGTRAVVMRPSTAATVESVTGQPCAGIVDAAKLPPDGRSRYVRVLCRERQDDDTVAEYTLRYADEHVDVYRK